MTDAEEMRLVPLTQEQRNLLGIFVGGRLTNHDNVLYGVCAAFDAAPRDTQERIYEVLIEWFPEFASKHGRHASCEIAKALGDGPK